jgi:hypothetical protein
MGTASELDKKHPSGAKAQAHFVAFAARLKRCPFTSCRPDSFFHKL